MLLGICLFLSFVLFFSIGFEVARKTYNKRYHFCNLDQRRFLDVLETYGTVKKYDGVSFKDSLTIKEGSNGTIIEGEDFPGIDFEKVIGK